MNSRERILAAVKNNQPPPVDLPGTGLPLAEFPAAGLSIKPDREERRHELASEFAALLGSIGGSAYRVSGYEEIATILKEKFAGAKRILSNCSELSGMVIGEGNRGGEKEGRGIEMNGRYSDAHELADTDLAILRAHFGVAENAAVWLTEQSLIERALPFICQHLAVVIDKKDIVGTMHEAYERIGKAAYGFGVFIAGPSKTADIEQSLVLGAHGAVSMTVFVVE